MSMRRLCTTHTAISLHTGADPASSVMGTFTPSQLGIAVDRSSDGEWIQVRFTPSGTPGWGAAAGIALHDVLLADLSAYQAHPDWAQAMTSVQLGGAFLKATEGVSLDDHGWFAANWAKQRTSAGDRYGDTWFRGAYHYFIFHDDPVAQAEYFLRTVEQAGGWGAGDLAPVIDVEAGGANQAAWAQESADRIVSAVETYGQKIVSELGCPVMLYGGSAIRSKNITSAMGCDALWTAEYGPSQLRASLHEEMGWSDAKTVLWQYTDGVDNGTGFPKTIAGLGGDLSVYRPNDLGVLAASLAWKKA